MTIDEHITDLWSKVYDGCDPAVEDNPRKYSLGWFSAGYHAGMKDGQKISAEAVDIATVKREKQIREAGYAHGLAYAAWIAASTRFDIAAARGHHDAARIAHDAILTALRAAEEIARERAQG